MAIKVLSNHVLKNLPYICNIVIEVIKLLNQYMALPQGGYSDIFIYT